MVVSITPEGVQAGLDNQAPLWVAYDYDSLLNLPSNSEGRREVVSGLENCRTAFLERYPGLVGREVTVGESQTDGGPVYVNRMDIGKSNKQGIKKMGIIAPGISEKVELAAGLKLEFLGVGFAVEPQSNLVVPVAMVGSGRIKTYYLYESELAQFSEFQTVHPDPLP